jgi:hypothetical protein
MSNLLSNSIEEMEKLLVKAKKVKKGSTLEDAVVEGAWLTAYAQITRRCRDDRDSGVTRYLYELGPGVNPFTPGYFEHCDWLIRSGMERHASLRSIYEFEAHYVNLAGFCMAFSTAAMALRGEAIAKPDTMGAEYAKKYEVWGMMGVRYGLMAVGLRVEVYKKSAKDPMHTRLLMPILEGNNDKAATNDLDDVLKKLDSHTATQLMKAATTLHATNAMKRSGDDGSASQEARPLFLPDGSLLNTESMRGDIWDRQNTFFEPFRTVL